MGVRNQVFRNPNEDYYKESDVQSHRKIYHCGKMMKPYIRGYTIDIGCGNGFVTDYLTADLNPNQVLCVDIVDRYEKELKLKGYNFMKMDLDNLPYDLPDNAFDTIILSDVLEHLMCPFGTLSEIYRILKHGGHLILTTPDCDRETPSIPHINYFSQRAIQLNLERVGFLRQNIKRVYNGVISPRITAITSKIPIIRSFLSNGCYYICKK